MLFALLYNEIDEIVAAGPACDQLPMGDVYWRDCHTAKIEMEGDYQIAYVNIISPHLQQLLFWVGIDEMIDRREVTNWVESFQAPNHLAKAG
ncbi:MAG: hypothetical protein AAFN77_19065 [Planctomycetota bacterium]